MIRLTRILLFSILLIAVGLLVLNHPLLWSRRTPGKPVLLAHRGVAQRFDTRDLKNDTCTAARMLPPKHAFLENTIPSIRASFDAGADIAEIDIHPTTDGQFAVFHDWTLDCRTNGKGVTRKQPLAYLKTLDVGYGYTADGGKTFPFRGKGTGMLPSLHEVLTIFPNRRFLVNVKSNDPNEGKLLAAYFRTLPIERQSSLIVYGGNQPIAALKKAAPKIRAFSKKSLQSCFLDYELKGWSGYIPESCRNTALLVPINVAPWLWGWPDLFLDRMANAGTEVFVIGPYTGGDFSTGIDTPADFAQLPAGYSGGIWTNEVQTVSKLVKTR